jgi:hypothetical protein
VDLQQVRDLIGQREQTAAATASLLREQITTLTSQLDLAEAELADLATTRHTLATLTGDPQPATSTGTGETTATARPGSPGYTQILSAFTSPEPLRASGICLALGLDAIPRNTESIRAKLKRLVTRGTLREDQPGLFTLATHPRHDQHP